MKWFRETFLIDQWIELLVRKWRSGILKREIYRCMRFKIKYEVSKQICDELYEDFCNRYPDSPLNKRHT